QRIPTPLASARESLTRYVESPSPGARQIAEAVLGSVPRRRNLPPTGGTSETSEVGVSLMIHGTAAYTGTWWLVGGDFHTYIKNNVRPDLFSGHNTFWWSGRYSKKHREVSARRLVGWADDTVGGSLNTIFAHSYG